MNRRPSQAPPPPDPTLTRDEFFGWLARMWLLDQADQAAAEAAEEQTCDDSKASE
jgi:hypothetical protein